MGSHTVYRKKVQKRNMKINVKPPNVTEKD